MKPSRDPADHRTPARLRDRLIRTLFVANWRRPPTVRNILSVSALCALAWGVVFGLIDAELLAVGNWLYALFGGALFAATMFAFRGLDRWARRHLGESPGL